MDEIKAEFVSQDDYDEGANEDDHEQGGITRSQAREKTIEVIQSKFPDYLVDKASRKEGSGIKVNKPDAKRPLIIKFYHSKSFEHRSGGFEHGWHVVRLHNVIATIIDLCIFSYVDSNANWSFFIYEPDEIGMYYDENRSSDNDILHLYFVVKDGKGTEVREKTIDVTDHLNNWNMLK